MEGKPIQVESSGNVIEAVGIARFSFEGNEYLIYSLNEEYEKNGQKLDKIYVSQINAPALSKITDETWDKLKKVISEMGETISTNLYEYKLLPLEGEEDV